MPDDPRTMPFETFKEIYSKVPRLCVDLVIKGPDGLLLTLRKMPPHEGEWHLPGGTVFLKEPIKEAIRRVAKDELGIDVQLEKLLGYIEYLESDQRGGFGYPVSLAFLCSPKDGELRVNGQASDIKYFKELPHNLIPTQKEFLQKSLTYLL